MGAGRMTSLEIAQVTGKMHKDVMKAIRNMEPAWLKVNGGFFSLVDYKDSKTIDGVLYADLAVHFSWGHKKMQFLKVPSSLKSLRSTGERNNPNKLLPEPDIAA